MGRGEEEGGEEVAWSVSHNGGCVGRGGAIATE